MPQFPCLDEGPAPLLHTQSPPRLLGTFLLGRKMSCVICYDNFSDVCGLPSAPPATLPFMINDITPNLHLAMQISPAVTDAAVHMETSYLYPLALNKRLGRSVEPAARRSRQGRGIHPHGRWPHPALQQPSPTAPRGTEHVAVPLLHVMGMG